MLNYVFPVSSVFVGVGLASENITFESPKFFEIMVAFYSFCYVISILQSFHWGKMVVAFWIVSAYHFTIMYLTYDSLPYRFCLALFFVNVLFPFTSMQVSLKVLNLLRIINENLEVIETLKELVLLLIEYNFKAVSSEDDTTCKHSKLFKDFQQSLCSLFKLC